MSETQSTVAIALSGVELNVQVGEHPWEKFPQRPTRLRLDMTLTFAYQDYMAKHGGYVDYDPLRAFLKDLETQPHVDQLEKFARQILEACLSLTPAARVRLSIQKPDIFNEMEGVGLVFDVSRQDFRA